MIKIIPKASNRQEEEKTESIPTTTPGKLRLQKELTDLDLPANTTLRYPDVNDIMNFEIVINITEPKSLWYQATYAFLVQVDAQYPHNPPKVTCKTKIYHPNIDLNGNVCLNILRGDWKPVLGINSVILGLGLLFIEPNPNDPLNQEAAETMRNNLQLFQENVRRSLRGGKIGYETFPRLLS